MVEVTHVWEKETYGKYLYLPLSFAVNLKPLYKLLLIKKEKVNATNSLYDRYTAGKPLHFSP